MTFMGIRSKFLRIFSLLALLFIFVFLSSQTFAAGVVNNVSTTDNFNIRIDGALADHQIGYNGASQGEKLYIDIDRDGKLDLVLGAALTDYNGRTNSGSVYIISGNILDNFAGTGNTLDLADNNNYSLRIDGSVASGNLSASSGVVFADINNDGDEDLLVSESFADSNRGNIFVLDRDLFEPYLSTTGNTLDLADSNNYNYLLQGASAGDVFGNLSIVVADVDNDGKNDIICEAHHDDNNDRAESGSVFIFFNTLLDDFPDTGNILNVGTLSNFSVRIDGAAAQETLGGGSTHVADYNADGLLDLFLGSDLTDFNGSASGSIWIIDNSKIAAFANTSGNLIDMADETNWVVRMDGVNTEDRITYANSLIVTDITRDGNVDIVVGSFNSDYNSRSNSGSIWIIDNELFGSQTGYGNIVNIESNFLVRIDGAMAGDNFTFGAMTVADINSNGRLDLIAAAKLADTNGTNSGAVYVFFDSMLDTWFETPGTLIDLLDTNNFSVRYDGATGDEIYFQNGFFGDFNGDSQLDFNFNSRTADNNGRSNSGSYYFFYNFPHTITISSPLSSTLTSINQIITGTVTAPNSTTTIASVEYSLDSNSPTTNWTACTPTDGAMDSLSETFTCSVNTNNLDQHNVYIRASDSNGYLTAQSGYANISFLPRVISSQAITPTCNDFITTTTPNLFQIETEITSAKLFFTPILHIENYFISYSTNVKAEEHGVLINVGALGVQHYKINDLAPNTNYYFKIRGQNGCMPGEWSNILSGKTKSLYISSENITQNSKITEFSSTSKATLQPTPNALINSEQPNPSAQDSEVLGGFDETPSSTQSWLIYSIAFIALISITTLIIKKLRHENNI
jgi:hypothetical protein